MTLLRDVVLRCLVSAQCLKSSFSTEFFSSTENNIQLLITLNEINRVSTDLTISLFVLLSLSSPLNHAPVAHVLQPKMVWRTRTKTKTKRRRSQRFFLAHAHINRSRKLPASWSAPLTPVCQWPSYLAEIIPVSTQRWRTTLTAMNDARICWMPKMWEWKLTHTHTQ